MLLKVVLQVKDERENQKYVWWETVSLSSLLNGNKIALKLTSYQAKTSTDIFTLEAGVGSIFPKHFKC